jgi:CTP synthase (UTP-ammonia lyase)
MHEVKVGLIGDFDKNMYTHVALNDAIEHCNLHLDFKILANWISTESITKNFFINNLYQGFWITPGSPYKNDAAVYDAITWARENNFPILGTCGGFQYMVVEYARNVLAFADVGHEESEPTSKQLIVSKMSCSLKGQQEEVFIADKQSWLYKILKTDKFTGKFNCSYGVNPVYQDKINKSRFTFTAFSNSGEARALELKGHRFFNGTLFQPPLDSTHEKPNPLIMSFFKIL